MVRLFSTNSETATPALFFAPALFLILLVTTAVVSVGALGTYASFPQPSKSSTVDANLGLLLDWVEKTGRPTVIRAVVARAFGLDDRDFPVKEKGFHESGEEFTHVFSVASSPAQEGGVFLALVNENDGQATVWRMSQSGILLATVIFADGVAQAVPNSRFESEFAAEFRYFLRKAQVGVSNANSSKVIPGVQYDGHSQPPAPFYRPLLVLASVDPNDGSGTLWSVSPKGRVVATIPVAGGAVKQISNADFRGKFAAKRNTFSESWES